MAARLAGLAVAALSLLAALPCHAHIGIIGVASRLAALDRQKPPDTLAQTLACIERMEWVDGRTRSAAAAAGRHLLPRVSTRVQEKLVQWMRHGPYACDSAYMSLTRLDAGQWSVPRDGRCAELVHDALTSDFGGAFAQGLHLVLVGDSLTWLFEWRTWLKHVARLNPALSGRLSSHHLYVPVIPRSEIGLREAVRTALCAQQRRAHVPVVVFWNMGLWYNGPADGWPRTCPPDLTTEMCTSARALTPDHDHPEQHVFAPRRRWAYDEGRHNGTTGRGVAKCHLCGYTAYGLLRRDRNELTERDYSADLRQLRAVLADPASQNVPCAPPAPGASARAVRPLAMLWRESTPRHFGTTSTDPGTRFVRPPPGHNCSCVAAFGPADEARMKWRNTAGNAIMRSRAVPVLPVHRPLARHGEWHTGDGSGLKEDCAHYCEPSPAHTLVATAYLSAAAAVVRRHRHRERPRA